MTTLAVGTKVTFKANPLRKAMGYYHERTFDGYTGTVVSICRGYESVYRLVDLDNGPKGLCLHLGELIAA